ncbi:hypothetical protein [Sansalvadorimonas verongulae]|uniref:hypothetical protein n=1 Tax=Sansalvadorimonas verongulae TaxID=2172824 RepID=UPI0012BD6AD5|nr:hypothetical protein [Sansalvadorimonas verongulae]MTI14380.1 hypothetical protein [Sansalvadorimonas verongulae]
MLSPAKITMVKKIMMDGSPCQKCVQVMEKLESSGHINSISRIVEAREDDPGSEGMQLSSLLGVDKAPFFVVEREGQTPEVFTIYFKLVKEVLEA